MSEPGGTIVPFPGRRTYDGRRLAEVGAGALFVRWLVGRHHHPLAWLRLILGGVIAAPVALAIWPYLLGAAALLYASHLHSRRSWSFERIVLGALVLMATLVVIGLVLASPGLAPAILAGAAGLVAWRTWGQEWLAGW